MKRTLTALVLIVLILLTACQSTGKNGSDNLQGKPWVNSNIYDNWPSERPALEENFELHVNYDRYMEAKENGIKKDSPLSQASNAMVEAVRSLIADTSKSTVELELMRAYYKLFADEEQRNAQGNEPLLLYTRMVSNATTLEELSEEVRKGLLFGDAFAEFAVDKTSSDTTHYGVWVESVLPFRSRLKGDFSDENIARVRARLTNLMILAGYTEGETAQALDLMESYEVLADKISQEYYEKTGVTGEDAVPMTLDEIKDFCTPLYDQLIGLGYWSAEGLPVMYDIYDAGLFYAIGQMYIPDNLEIIKSIYNVSMASYAKQFLDIPNFAEMYDFESFEDFDIDLYSFQFVYQSLASAVDQTYLEFVFPKGVRQTITDLTVDYIAAMRARLENTTWLTDVTKARALDKVDKMLYIVVYPDYWIDYSELLELVADHDQFLLDAVLCRDDFYRGYMTSLLGHYFDRTDWVYLQANSIVANAYYKYALNVITILAGILFENRYFDTSIETIMASIGTIIGHEITHGFDTTGCKFNEMGDPEIWWTDEDYKLFNEKAARIADALSQIEPLDGYNVNGEFVVGETIADLGGLVLTLDLAKKYPDFDYDLFFRTFMNNFYEIMPDAETAMDNYIGDNHTADYIRANFNVQMMDEFYETYPQVVEGTTMYRAPEDRLSVW